MRQILHEFPSPIAGERDRSYRAQVRGALEDDGLWHGWIEFVPEGGGPALQTGRETTQSDGDQLEYWASGLSGRYLESALRRARVTHSTSPAPPPPLEHLPYDPALIREPHDASSVVELEIEAADPGLPGRLMRTGQPRVGSVRRLPGAGIIVYDGGDEGPSPHRHRFLLQYATDNAAAVLANHLWSDLRDETVNLRVAGRRVAISAHSLAETLQEHV